MNKSAAKLALGLFFIVFFIEILRMNYQFEMIQQNIQQISQFLFSEYVIPFELLSLVLVGGIIGMFYIAGKEEES